MKDHKYRAWRVDAEIMTEPFTFMDISEGALNFIQKGLKDGSVILLDYIGIKIKNKEIYEGDIIKVSCVPTMYIEVKWNEEEVKFDTDSLYWKFEPEQLSFYEVVGNIYSDRKILK